MKGLRSAIARSRARGRWLQRKDVVNTLRPPQSDSRIIQKIEHWWKRFHTTKSRLPPTGHALDNLYCFCVVQAGRRVSIWRTSRSPGLYWSVFSRVARAAAISPAMHSTCARFFASPATSSLRSNAGRQSEIAPCKSPDLASSVPRFDIAIRLRGSSLRTSCLRMMCGGESSAGVASKALLTVESSSLLRSRRVVGVVAAHTRHRVAARPLTHA
jgi:hypothetical protein